MFATLPVLVGWHNDEGWVDMKKIKKIVTMVICAAILATSIPSTIAHASCLHDWEEWEVWTKPTCSREGYETRSCKKCYESESRHTPATGIHRWTNWKADGYLCEDGKYSRYCQDCYKNESKARKGNGKHLYSSWNTTRKPDCLNKGKKYRYCRNCYTYFYQDIAAKPNSHDWSSWHINYLKKKRIERTCYVCGKVEVKKVTVYPAQKTLKKGKSITLKIKKHVSGDSVKLWKSNNKKIATVNSKGKVTAKKKGNATITVYMKSGAKASCKVKVK